MKQHGVFKTQYNSKLLATIFKHCLHLVHFVWFFLKGTFSPGCDALHLFEGTSNVSLSLVLPISKPFGSSFNTFFKFKNLST